jgi:hypothetical protein
MEQSANAQRDVSYQPSSFVFAMPTAITVGTCFVRRHPVCLLDVADQIRTGQLTDAHASPMGVCYLPQRRQVLCVVSRETETETETDESQLTSPHLT